MKFLPDIHTDLREAYDKLPSTRCKRKTACCSLMPEMSFIEALNALQNVLTMRQDKRLLLYKKIVYYFIVNPVMVVTCPFLEGKECLIYRNRFFGCRAYGLWSKEYYENLAERSRHAKKHIRTVWENMNIYLPKEITEFQVPYCTDVVPVDMRAIHDDTIFSIAENIENLSRQFNHWHHLFIQAYFSDFSFLLTSLVFGVHEAVSLKFNIVSDIVNKGSRARLHTLLNKIPDIFEGI